MFSDIKKYELMESEHSGIFRVELVTKIVVLLGDPFAYEDMRVM